MHALLHFRFSVAVERIVVSKEVFSQCGYLAIISLCFESSEVEHSSVCQIFELDAVVSILRHGREHHTWDLPTIININARSLNAEKVDELQVIVDDYDIDVACITETWSREYMDDTNLALEVFCLERKDRDHRRGGGVACYIRNDIEYNRLRELEDDMLEVLWIKVMPRRLPRKFSCILVGCLYYTHQTDLSQMGEHVITGIDILLHVNPSYTTTPRVTLVWSYKRDGRS